MSDKPRRLGRGLSGLVGMISEPVRVEVPAQAEPISLPERAEVAAPMAPSVSAPVSPPVTAPISAAIVTGTSESAPAQAGVTAGGSKMLRLVAIGSIQPNRYQPRGAIDEAGVKMLAASIRASGLMQPIVIRPVADAGPGIGYELVAGERRWRAAGEAGLTMIPALVRDLSNQESAEWAIVENVQREDLNPLDKGRAYRRLSESFGLSHAEIADRVGVERSSVTNLVRLTELEPLAASLVASGELTFGHGRALLTLERGMFPEGTQDQWAKAAAEKGWSVRKLEEFTRAMVERAKAGTPTIEAKPEAQPRDLRGEAIRMDLEKRLSERLGTRVRVRTDKKGRRGSISVEFYDLDHFEGILKKMGME
ncbi:MAG: ParB/RepB/Spo0J family partition protein [Planctomycetota bacterium]|nr:ParB/RepB/Spo0J family partition protein [Planctomycetota bacterium]